MGGEVNSTVSIPVLLPVRLTQHSRSQVVLVEHKRLCEPRSSRCHEPLRPLSEGPRVTGNARKQGGPAPLVGPLAWGPIHRVRGPSDPGPESAPVSGQLSRVRRSTRDLRGEHMSSTVVGSA